MDDTEEKVTSTEPGDWRCKVNSKFGRFVQARKIDFHTDVVFRVGNGDSAEEFSAHKLFLAIASPVFEAMFYGELTESKTPIPITDIEPEAFGMLIRYVYEETVYFTSMQCALRTYIAADKYLVDGLKMEVQQYLHSAEMTDSEFWEIAEQELNLNILSFRWKFLDYFETNAHILLKSDLFISLSPTVVEMFLKMDYIRVTEYELLYGICRWARGHSLSESKFKSKFRYLLGFIRFSTISASEFCHFDDYFRGIINPDDTLAILKYLTDRTRYRLPDWCSTETRVRISETPLPNRKNMRLYQYTPDDYNEVFYN